MGKTTRKIAIIGGSILLNMLYPLYSESRNSNGREAHKLEQEINSIKQNLNEEIEQLETTITDRIGDIRSDLNDLSLKLEETSNKLQEIDTPRWYSGPVGYALGLLIGVAGIFGYDYLKKIRRVRAYNETAEEYFEKEEFDSSICSLECALTIDSTDKETRYSLIDALIRVENDLINNGQDIDEEELSRISRRIDVEIITLKKYDKKDFVPCIFEGDRLYFEGVREKDSLKKKDRFVQAFEKYKEAIKKYKGNKLRRGAVELKVNVFKGEHKRLNNLYRMLGCILMEYKKDDKAIIAFKEALKYDRHDSISYNILMDKVQKDLEKTQDLNSQKDTYNKGRRK